MVYFTLATFWLRCDFNSGPDFVNNFKESFMKKRKSFLRVGIVLPCIFVLLLGSLLGCEEDTKNYTLDQVVDLSSAPNNNVSSTAALSTYTVTSPYQGVNWDTYDQYKAAMHTHTTRSDGANTLAQMIEELYRQNFDIVAISDHNAVNSSWTTGLGRLTEERYAEIQQGLGTNGSLRGMLMIPYADEQSRGEHMNSFFVDFNNASGSTLATNIAQTGFLGGLSHINHIGRYTHGSNPDPQVRINVSSDPAVITKYVDLFIQYPSCVGMEIVNRRDVETYSDRILWDNVLKQTIPQGRNVWGFANDDSHSSGASENGNSYNMFVMSANNLENVKAAMVSGSFYTIARVSKLELGESFYGQNDVPPTIKSITVEGSSITITTENVTKIDWISDGEIIGTTTASSSVFDVSKVGSYIRANLMGPGGIAFTQPFIINK
jgi:hypothetical protein